MNVDLLSLSGHKMYGPKGIGALYVRRKPRVRLKPLISGGGQERGVRSGTLPTPLCVGLGHASVLAAKEMDSETERLRHLQRYMIADFHKNLEDVVLNGDATQRIPGNINMSFSHVEGEGLMMGVKDLAISSGSACTSASLEPSYVLRALGVDEEVAHSSLRIGLGRFTTKADVDQALKSIIREVRRLRDMSPLWEMHQNGIDLKSISWQGH